VFGISYSIVVERYSFSILPRRGRSHSGAIRCFLLRVAVHPRTADTHDFPVVLGAVVTHCGLSGCPGFRVSIMSTRQFDLPLYKVRQYPAIVAGADFVEHEDHRSRSPASSAVATRRIVTWAEKCQAVETAGPVGYSQANRRIRTTAINYLPAREGNHRRAVIKNGRSMKRVRPGC